METFAKLSYVRPEMETIMSDVKAITKTMETAASWEEFKNAYMDWVKLDMELTTAQTIVHIRNTVDMWTNFMRRKIPILMHRCHDTGFL